MNNFWPQLFLIIFFGLITVALIIALIVVAIALREMITEWHSERTFKRILQAEAVYDYVPGLNGELVKVPMNHAALRSMTEIELHQVIAFTEDRDRYLAKLEEQL